MSDVPTIINPQPSRPPPTEIQSADHYLKEVLYTPNYQKIFPNKSTTATITTKTSSSTSAMAQYGAVPRASCCPFANPSPPSVTTNAANYSTWANNPISSPETITTASPQNMIHSNSSQPFSSAPAPLPTFNNAINSNPIANRSPPQFQYGTHVAPVNNSLSCIQGQPMIMDNYRVTNPIYQRQQRQPQPQLISTPQPGPLNTSSAFPIQRQMYTHQPQASPPPGMTYTSQGVLVRALRYNGPNQSAINASVRPILHNYCQTRLQARSNDGTQPPPLHQQPQQVLLIPQQAHQQFSNINYRTSLQPPPVSSTTTRVVVPTKKDEATQVTPEALNKACQFDGRSLMISKALNAAVAMVDHSTQTHREEKAVVVETTRTEKVTSEKTSNKIFVDRSSSPIRELPVRRKFTAKRKKVEEINSKKESDTDSDINVIE